MGVKKGGWKRGRDSATAGTRALLQESLQSITAGMKLKLSAGTQLAHGRAGLGWRQPRPRHGLPFPQLLWARLALGQTQVLTNAVTCLLL